MALSKKPTKPIADTEGVDIDALINKGGSVPMVKAAVKVEKIVDEKPLKKVLKGGMIPIQLRLSPDIVDRIDGLIADRVIPTSRHNWFVEAIADKIKKESIKEG
jgi:hypothetical protein